MARGVGLDGVVKTPVPNTVTSRTVQGHGQGQIDEVVDGQLRIAHAVGQVIGQDDQTSVSCTCIG